MCMGSCMAKPYGRVMYNVGDHAGVMRCKDIEANHLGERLEPGYIANRFSFQEMCNFALLSIKKVFGTAHIHSVDGRYPSPKNELDNCPSMDIWKLVSGDWRAGLRTCTGCCSHFWISCSHRTMVGGD